MYHDLILRAVPRTVPCTTIVPQYCTVLSPCAPYRTIYTKTPNGRYFHLSYLMKILVLIWAYHRTYFYFFSLILYNLILFDTFKGSELIIRRICFLHIEEKTIDYKKKSKKIWGGFQVFLAYMILFRIFSHSGTILFRNYILCLGSHGKDRSRGSAETSC